MVAAVRALVVAPVGAAGAVVARVGITAANGRAGGVVGVMVFSPVST